MYPTPSMADQTGNAVVIFSIHGKDDVTKEEREYLEQIPQGNEYSQFTLKKFRGQGF